MKRILFFSLLFLCTIINANHPVKNVKQVILWGHKPKCHTHSYIHAAFERAFKHLGYTTYWFDDSDNISNHDFSNALFITEGQVDGKIPIRSDCFYVIHNCNTAKYQKLINSGNAIILQVYTHDCLARKEPSIAPYIHYDLKQPIIYMPWATDLLPHEIDLIKIAISRIKSKRKHAVFVGTISGGQHGNREEINQFRKSIEEEGYAFINGGVRQKSMEENIEMVQYATFAPSIQGAWQCEHGYIPCRIFKNISYGAMGITNSQTVFDLFEGKICYASDPYTLGKKSIETITNWSIEQQYTLMDFVKNNHTYLNRIKTLFDFFEMVATYKKGILI